MAGLDCCLDCEDVSRRRFSYGTLVRPKQLSIDDKSVPLGAYFHTCHGLAVILLYTVVYCLDTDLFINWIAALRCKAVSDFTVK